MASKSEELKEKESKEAKIRERKTAMDAASSGGDRDDDKDANDEEDEKIAIEFEEEAQTQAPLLVLANWRFLLQQPDTLVDAARKAELKVKVLAHIKENSMGPYYTQLCGGLVRGWTEDSKFAAELKAANEAELKTLDGKVQEAKDKAGETEVRDALLARADFFARIGDKTSALAAYEVALAKTVGAGGRIDLVLSIVRLALFTDDLPLLATNITRAKNFVEKGGDWERRNLLHVYEAVYFVQTRRFKEAAALFLDSTATFTCHKLISYNSFVFLTVVSALVSLDRVTLRDKVILNPDVLSVIREVPNLRSFAFSLYNCQYAEFFSALAAITPQLKQDIYLSQHVDYLLREIRIAAYAQFLESYRSVTLASFATSFGVSETFIDRELARFISAGRLNCKIDKVGGIVETNRPDTRNAQYAEAIKQGDLLLNRIQKLSKAIAY